MVPRKKLGGLGDRITPSTIFWLAPNDGRIEREWSNTGSQLTRNVSALRTPFVGDSKVVVASKDSSLKLFDASSQKLINEIQIGNHVPTEAVLTADEKFAIAGTSEGKLLLVDIESSKIAQEVTSMDTPISAMQYSQIHLWLAVSMEP